MGIVKAKNLTFEYIRRDEDGNVEGITKAVDNVSIDIKQGDFVAVLGHNGSGKSTFAKHLNALVMPTEGTVWVDSMDTREEENTLKLELLLMKRLDLDQRILVFQRKKYGNELKKA